jgi:hypothetical protein
LASLVGLAPPSDFLTAISVLLFSLLAGLEGTVLPIAALEFLSVVFYLLTDGNLPLFSLF